MKASQGEGNKSANNEETKKKTKNTSSNEMWITIRLKYHFK